MLDTVDKVNLTGLRDASALAARIALRATQEEPWPVEQRGKEEVRKLMDRPPHSETEEYRVKLEKLLEGK